MENYFDVNDIVDEVEEEDRGATESIQNSTTSGNDKNMKKVGNCRCWGKYQAWKVGNCVEAAAGDDTTKVEMNVDGGSESEGFMGPSIEYFPPRKQ